MQKMKAVMCYGKGRLNLEEIDIPALGPKDTLISVKAVGICGSDFELFKGSSTLSYIKYPIVPGHEITGIVEDVGNEVKNFSPGDKVLVEQHLRCGECFYCKTGRYFFCENYLELGFTRNGGYAEYCLVPSTNLIPVRDDLPIEYCLLAEPAGIMARCFRRISVRNGDLFIVLGAGPLGMAAVQVVKATYASRVILLDRDANRLARGTANGADSCINTGNQTWLETLRSQIPPNGIDVVIDCAGATTLTNEMLPLMTKGGAAILLGLSNNGSLTLPQNDTVLKEISVVGVVTAMGSFEEGLEMVCSGRLKPQEFITHSFPLEEFQTGIEYVEERIDGCVKVFLKP